MLISDTQTVGLNIYVVFLLLVHLIIATVQLFSFVLLKQQRPFVSPCFSFNFNQLYWISGCTTL